MFKMREPWIKVGCFLTGYNYTILRNCSEVSKKAVKKYTAAMIIMCLLWGIIGFSFASRYLHADIEISIACSLVFIVIIIQIERQIIMQTHKNNYLQIFRGVIAVMMAFIGSIIIDQIIFKDDIDLQKEQFINNKVEEIYPDRAKIRQKQINQLNSQLAQKDSQRTALNSSIQKNPVINTITTQTNLVPVTTSETNSSTGNVKSQTKYISKPVTATSQIPNPNIALLAPLDSQITALNRMVIAQNDSLANLRTSIEIQLKQKTGFLDELDIMVSLLGRSIPALVVYTIWFFLLLGLEFFILMNKRHEKPTDYDSMIAHQMDMHVKKLNILSGA